MGISHHEARALVELYKRNGPFGRTATLGRQDQHLTTASLRRLLDKLEVAAGLNPQGVAEHGFPSADAFLKTLGATEVISFDCADYEGASIVHDMNLPVPVHFRESFDLVYDGGTLEHIYNFPQAVTNCMDMLKVSGLLVASNPANNFLGHGFYQFSPELFYRLFSPENGFRVERMLAFDCARGGPWYEVRDPKKMGRRVELLATGCRVQLWVEARKIRPVPHDQFAVPQQSDYVRQWTKRENSEPPPAGRYQPLKQALAARGDKYCPRLSEWLQGMRDRWRCRRAQQKHLGSGMGAFRRIR
jgi:SAM-dependent methyltransferase